MSDSYDIDDLDLSDAGDLDMPTMRGNANLDVQDYQRYPGEPGSSMLDDELQEDTPSTPGSGAGPAPDVDGMDRFDLLDSTEDDPGMDMGTEYGSYPWRVGSGGGYRPASMRTDLSGDEMSPSDEVAVRAGNSPQPVPPPRRHPQRNRMPSNAGVDPSTLYDRSSFEYDDDPQNVIGTGIFDTEEGVQWNARDGIFGNDFALPAYVAQEGELDVQQSQMWDSVANNWRVVQPSGGGVTFATRVPFLKPTNSPFVDQQFMRPDRMGPRSHIEAFGRAAAKAIVAEAQTIQPTMRSTFLTNAIESLGPGKAAKCREVADQLVAIGYSSQDALEDTIAHCAMHAILSDLSDRRSGKPGLPRIDRMGRTVRSHSADLNHAVAMHVAPIVADQQKGAADVAAFTASPSAKGMGQVATPESPTSALPTPSTAGKTILIGAAVVGVGYLFLTKTRQGKKVQRNVKKHARKFAREIGVR